jgi:hypothetical protein
VALLPPWFEEIVLEETESLAELQTPPPSPAFAVLSPSGPA